MAIAHLTLFGKFDLRLAGGSKLDLPGQKDRALLAILAVSSSAALPRDKLTGLLWSDRADTQARDSLKQALKHIRQAFNDAVPDQAGEELVTAVRHEVRLGADWISVDVKAFEGLIRKGTPDSLEEANRLYTGEFLEGIVVNDASFESWLLAERQRLRHLQEQALTKLLEPALDTEIRERAALSLLELDPTREAAARVLMQVHVERGESAQAVKLFDRLRDRLHIDLGIRPEQETVDIYQAIRSGALRAADDRSTSISEPQLTMRAADGPDLLGKPSIAVLPFENMSGDPEQNYFADGITEDIITELSRFRELSVTARHVSFHYGGKGANLQQLARDLGVKYVVEGSVRKPAERLRITAQLIDAKSGNHIWAERYDRNAHDIFAVQDEVVSAIVSTLAGRTVAAAAELARRRPPASWSAYDCLLQGRELCNYLRERDAIPYFVQATRIDPNFAQAQSWLALALVITYVLEAQAQLLSDAAQAAQRALALNANDATVHWANAMVLTYLREFEPAGVHFDRAIALNPADVQIRADHANWLRFTGQLEEALDAVDSAFKPGPLSPQWFWAWRGEILFDLKRYREAIEAFNSVPQKSHFCYSYMAAAYVYLGDDAIASQALARAKGMRPTLTIQEVTNVTPHVVGEVLNHLLNGLRKAGLPE